MLKAIKISILMLTLSACSRGFDSSKPVVDHDRNLQSAKAKWVSKNYVTGSYSITLGFSGAFGYQEIISIVDAATSKVTACTESFRYWHENSTTYSPCSTDRGDSVESLFSRIEDSIATGKLGAVEYDSASGVPLEIYIRGSDSSMADTSSGYFTRIQIAFPIP